MMTVLLLYAYSQGLTSSRQIERRCREDLAFMYLTADACPDHDTICAFRRAHLAAFPGLFLETLRIAQEAGVLKLGRLALDGTKIRANASKHKAMSYARMPERQAALQAEIQRLLEEAEALDRAEDAQYGRGRRGDELPTALQDPATRPQRLREAKARVEAARKRELAAEKQGHVAQIEAAQQALEAEAREHARAEGQPTPEAARPAPKAQRNFTDPESRIMKTPDGFQQCYNAQVAVTVGSQLIVAGDVVQAPNDKQQLQPMVDQVIANVGVPTGVIADSGYFSEANVQGVEGRADERSGPISRSSGIATGRRPLARRADASPRAECGGPDAPATAHDARPRDLRTAEDHRRTGHRPDQGPGLPSLLVARRGGREGRVPAGLRGPQSRQALADRGGRGAPLAARTAARLCLSREGRSVCAPVRPGVRVIRMPHAVTAVRPVRDDFTDTLLAVGFSVLARSERRRPAPSRFSEIEYGHVHD